MNNPGLDVMPMDGIPDECQGCPTEGSWTDSVDFNEGFLINLNDDVSGQLQLSATTRPLPFIWVAASGRGTVIRIDVNTGDILGEYRTTPSGQGSNPSRTTVDLDGSAWVANRADIFNNKGSVTKFGLVIGGTRVDSDGLPNPIGDYLAPPFDYCACEDRDGDDLIKTSRGLSDVRDWLNPNGEDNNGGVSTAEDECIIRYARVTGTGTRTVAIDENNDVWVGGTGSREHEKIDGFTGQPVSGTQFNLGCAGYGGLVDCNGVLWSASGASPLLRYETSTMAGACLSATAYGLGYDSQTGNIWSAAGGRAYKYAPDGMLLDNYLHGSAGFTQGIAVDNNGNVWVAAGNVAHLRTNGTPVGEVLVSGKPTGVAVDTNGKVWATNQNANQAARIDPNLGPIVNGYHVGEVDLVVDLGPAANPYNYSDMTGMVALQTSSTGTWTVIHDGNVFGAQWRLITWNTESCASPHEPSGTRLTVEIRAADTKLGLIFEPYTEVENGVPFFDVSGRFIQIRVRFKGTCPGQLFETPVLCDLDVTADLQSGLDCQPNGIPDECEPDCNRNGVADECDIDSQVSPDCNNNGIPDECEDDCNNNGVPDACDIDCGGPGGLCNVPGCGVSADCNNNCIPDDCEPDCDDNGVADDCELTENDCNNNGVLDACEPDCDGNGVPDDCELNIDDCNGNGTADECELDRLYAVDSDSLYVVDPWDGSVQLVGSFGLDVFNVEGFSIHPQTGEFYVMEPGPSFQPGFPGSITRVDRDTAEVELSVALNTPLKDIAFRTDGVLYGIRVSVNPFPGFSEVVIVDVSDGSVTSLLPPLQRPIGQGHSIAFEPSTGLLLHSYEITPGVQVMETINVDFGVVTEICSDVDAGPFNCLAFRPTGNVLLGFADNIAFGSDLYAINKFICDVASRGTNAQTITGMAFLPKGNDCNNNCVLDECDVVPIGSGPDCNNNGIPDECEPLGACCFDSAGTCIDCITVDECPGRFVLDEDCIGDPFTAPSCGDGACCVEPPHPLAPCFITTGEASCLSQGGFTWKGGESCTADCTPSPENDDCLNKTALTGQSVCVTFNNANATDSGVSNASCGAVNQDVWYAYTVPATIPSSNSGDLVVSTIGSNFDTVVAIYGPLLGSQAQACADVPSGTAQEAGCNDDLLAAEPLSCTSYVTISVVPGQTYKIRVGSAGNDPGGLGQLNIDYVPRTPAPFWNAADVGRCCFPDGTCRILNSTFSIDNQSCVELGGFPRNFTDFTNGENPSTEEAIGCKSVPCPGPGEACWNAIDLKADLGGSFGTITRLVTKKRYFKYRLVAGENFTIDTCGSSFNTFIEIFGGICDETSGEPDALIRLNDDCIFRDPDGTADAAREGASCFAPLGRAEADSCLCIDVNDLQEPGLQSGFDIIICIGAANPNRGDPMFPTAQNSIDPVKDECAQAALLTINITQVDACFTCNVDCVNDLTASQNLRRLDESEAVCDDFSWAPTNNGGCSVFPDPLGGFTPPVESINAFMTVNNLDFADGPIYICGTAGTIGIDQNDVNPNVELVGQQRDNDYYELVVVERKRVTWEVLKADFLVDFAVFRQDGFDPCNLPDAVFETTLTDCENGILSTDICPGRYYFVVRALADDNLKPPCGAEYMMSLACGPAAPPNCCRGDMNNDGVVNGADIQPWIQSYLFPNPVGTLDVLGGCGSLDFCRTDADGDGFLTIADVGAFVNALLTKQPCPVKPVCEDPSRCQFPGVRTGSTEAMISDLNPQGGLRLADNFRPTENGSVAEVCWWGMYEHATDGADCGPTSSDGFTLPLDDFTIIYYEDDDGCPGSVKFSGMMPATFSQSGGTLLNVTRMLTNEVVVAGTREFLFKATHAPVAVTAGQCCWIEIVNNTTGDCLWRWRTSATGDGRVLQHAGPLPYCCPIDERNGDMAFCVDLRISDQGCTTDPWILGRCCFLLGECLETTEEICSIVLDGYDWSPTDCGSPCPPPDCAVDFNDCNHREIEQCGSQKNDGCNDADNDASSLDPVESLGELTCGLPTVVCGTLFATGGAFDTDFYEFTLPFGGNCEWRATVEADVATNLFNLVLTDPQDPCGNLGSDAINIVQADGDCSPIMSMPICAAGVGPGNPVTIFVQIAGAGTAEFSCGTDNNYKLTIECVP
ncbi:MAG: hypothetical protein MI923_23535 [Phycisphaerales bacterium]|nr:hypothetical protein [Phycisphaerales bacterium]